MEGKKENNDVDEIELIKDNPHIKNAITSPFLSTKHSWDDEEHFTIPADILKGITDGQGFEKPSRI